MAILDWMQEAITFFATEVLTANKWTISGKLVDLLHSSQTALRDALREAWRRRVLAALVTEFHWLPDTDIIALHRLYESLGSDGRRILVQCLSNTCMLVNGLVGLILRFPLTAHSAMSRTLSFIALLLAQHPMVAFPSRAPS
jgi:hypothetical protein